MKKGKFLLPVILIICAAFFSACWSAESNSDNDETTSTRTTTTRTPKDDDKSTPDEDTPEDENGKTPENTMKETPTNDVKSGGFSANLPSGFNQPNDPVGQKMLREYGAMFIAKGVTPPNKVVFNSEAEVSAWQSGISKSSENIGGTTIELQTPAMNALKKAIDEAKQSGLTITPRGGSDAARRNYSGTVDNWNSRVEPNLKYYVGQGKIAQAEADRIKNLSIPQQISEIFKLEDKGMWFAKTRDKSIIYSVAPPGTSQHISMLALDVAEFENPKVRSILANNGWFQTVKSDLPHFTYLGVSESELPKLGLKKVSDSGRTFWTP